ncbi:PREDICTED: uncharacterized protein LOC104711034 [Camelina sativa]|uniref:Uncharacterized protein LOC104711034 n=1 Tax=Camelina sativa TaxID=90675 RepID=A0ABM0TGC1_CAMSA|nr:PREDICTED: uncharacterized protein LOC104711034 [Camelina sativa]
MDSRGNVSDEINVSSKAIRRKVKNALDIALTKYKIDSYNLVDLDKVLNDVYCSFRPVSADYDIRKELVRSLNAMAVDIYGDSEETSPVLEAYGSFVMDMYTSQSDLDVSINFFNGTSELTREKKIQILKRFAQKLRSLEGEGHVRNVESIVTARVPIVKFFDHGAAVECDLSVENKDGILNSQIIRIISQIDGRFQKLCMLVKHWAKAHEVNSALHRTLNSVSITQLVALHLQTQYPPILPPFSMLFKDGMDPPNVEKRTQKFLNWGQRNQESLGRLFATFFIKLQSVEFLWRQGLCVSVLNGLWIAKKWKKFGIASISVEDFTNVSQNVSRRVNGAGAKKIYRSIDRTVEDIFEFLNEKVTGTDLKHKLFGQIPVVHPPPVAPLNGKTGVFGQQDVVEPPPVPPLLSQQAALDPPPHVLPLTGAGRHLKRRKFGQQAVQQPRPSVPPPLSGKRAGTHLKRSRAFGQQAVVQPRPPVPPLNDHIARTHLRDRSIGQQAIVQPLPPVPSLSSNITETHLRDRYFGEQAVVERHPSVPSLNGNISGTYLRDRFFGQQAVVKPRPPVPSLNGHISGTYLRDRFFGQQEVVEPRPSVPSLNGNIIGTHLSDRFFGQQSVVEHRSPRSSLNVYPQQPHNNFRNGFNGLPEIHYNKRVCLGNGYRAVEETGHRREEESYDDLRELRYRYIGYCTETLHRNDDRYRGEEPMPVGQCHDYSLRTGPPQPQPPYGRDTYENFRPQNLSQPPPPYGRDSYGNFRPQNLPQPHSGRSFY